MIKNTAGQKLFIYAYDTVANEAATGEAANISNQISLDGDTSAAATNSVTELDSTNHPGIYVLELEQTETDADVIIITPSCSTEGVVIDPISIETINQTDIETLLTNTATDIGNLTLYNVALNDLYIKGTVGDKVNVLAIG